MSHRKNKYRFRLKEGPFVLNNVHIDCDELIRNMREREIFLLKEKEALKDLPHITINYEDHLLYVTEHQKTLARVFAYLDVPSVPVKTDFVRITSDRLSDLVVNYEEVTQVIENTQYAEFLAD